MPVCGPETLPQCHRAQAGLSEEEVEKAADELSDWEGVGSFTDAALYKAEADEIIKED